MPTIRMRVARDIPERAVRIQMERATDLSGDGTFNSACGGCRRLLLWKVSLETVTDTFFKPGLPTLVDCPFCGAVCWLPKGGAG